MNKVIKQKLFIGVGYEVEKLSILKYYPKWGSRGYPNFRVYESTRSGPKIDKVVKQKLLIGVGFKVKKCPF